MFEFELDEVKEVIGLAAADVLEWLIAHDVELEDCDCGNEIYLEDADLMGDFDLFIGGYWSDGAICIEFEDGKAARFYQEGDWE